MILVSSWPARPTNGIALDVFVGARRLADEHQVGVRVADAEHDLLAAERVQLAARAVADVRADRRKRVGRRVVGTVTASAGPAHRRDDRHRIGIGSRLRGRDAAGVDASRHAGSRLTPVDAEFRGELQMFDS